LQYWHAVCNVKHSCVADCGPFIVLSCYSFSYPNLKVFYSQKIIKHGCCWWFISCNQQWLCSSESK